MEDLLNYIPSIITTAVGLEQVKMIEQLRAVCDSAALSAADRVDNVCYGIIVKHAALVWSFDEPECILRQPTSGAKNGCNSIYESYVPVLHNGEGVPVTERRKL